MNTKIDIKSAVIGMVVGVLVTVGIAAETAPITRVGRYQIVSNANNGGQGGSHSLVIDTVTGRVWMGCLPSSSKSDDDFFQPKSAEK
jgi:ABC-type phosphate transport system permease subunit